MTLELPSEYTAYDYNLNVGICQKERYVVVYNDGVPTYQVSLERPIYASCIYQDQLLLVTETGKNEGIETELVTYDIDTGAMTFCQKLGVPPADKICCFVYSDKSLYLFIQVGELIKLFCLDNIVKEEMDYYKLKTTF